MLLRTDGNKRKNEKNSNAMIYISDELRTVYHLKEAFYKVLDVPNSTVVKQQPSDRILSAQNSGIPEFIACSNTLIHWQKWILNSFDVPYSNGFTEGCNNKIKVLKCNAYGYRNVSETEFCICSHIKGLSDMQMCG